MTVVKRKEPVKKGEDRNYRPSVVFKKPAPIVAPVPAGQPLVVGKPLVDPAATEPAK